MSPQPLPEAETALLGVDIDGPAVVAIGGGLGLSRTLEAVQTYAGAISAVVSVADDGGSSGRLTPALDIPPPGDLRKCLLALAPEPTIWSELFAHRFDRGDVSGHSLGNLMMAALIEITGEVSGGLRLAEDLLRCCGRVHPAALRAARLVGVVGGKHIDGQVSVGASQGTVSELRLEPSDLVANPAAVNAIREADQIVLSSGSLFTSLVAAILVPGIAEAINDAKASIVYIMNLVTQNAETLGFAAEDHVAALAAFGRIQRAGTIIAHDGPIGVPEGLEAVGGLSGDFAGWDVVGGNIVDPESEWPQHDPLALGRILSQLVGS